jgi:hypothetical protein
MQVIANACSLGRGTIISCPDRHISDRESVISSFTNASRILSIEVFAYRYHMEGHDNIVPLRTTMLHSVEKRYKSRTQAIASCFACVGRDNGVFGS